MSLGVGSERRSARQLVDLSEKAGVNLGSRFTLSAFVSGQHLLLSGGAPA